MIDFKSTFKMAILSLKTNKMRSSLTSLGIIIGVGAVIVMLAIGTGASTKVTKDMEAMGSNLLTIRSAAANQARKSGNGNKTEFNSERRKSNKKIRKRRRIRSYRFNRQQTGGIRKPELADNGIRNNRF